MFGVRFHGRGGQGVVTAAEMLAVAAFDAGRHAQAFPTFGSERTGAPVMSFCRIDDRPVPFHEPIDAPDALVVQDPTLLHQVRLFDGVPASAYLLVNSARSCADLGIAEYVARFAPERVAVLPATELARELLGRPLPNTALLGALAALTGVVPIEAVCAAVRQRFPGAVGEANAAVALRAHGALSRA